MTEHGNATPLGGEIARLRTRLGEMADALEAAERTAADAEQRAAAAERQLGEMEQCAAQAQTAERLRRLVDASIIGVVWADLHGTDVHANDAFLEMAGYTREDLREGKVRWSEMTPLEHRDRDEQALCELLEQGRAAPFEKDCVRGDGSRVPILMAAALLDEGTTNPYWAGFHIDISERKRLEEEQVAARKQSEEAALRAQAYAEELSVVNEELEATNEQLLVQHEANERAIEEVERLNAQLREANSAKDQFLAVLSHELRNPLSPILAGAELLRRTLPDGSRARDTLEIIERNAKLQARLVSDLLDLSRVTRGELNLQRAPVALDGVVSAAVEAHLAEAEAAGLALHTDTPAGLWVMGDFDRLQQVIANLISNAVKFTPRGGAIRVSLREAEGRGEVIVEDTGAGIDPALGDRLFEMFQQGEVGGQRRSGLGIGLALVKSLTDRHGGRVHADSAGPGRGSRFAVELPLIPGPVTTPPSLSRAPTPGCVRVLLVEDNPNTCAVLSENLVALGHTVDAAGSGEEALDLLAHTQPDLILSDIGLPGMDGYEFLRRAREVPGVTRIPAFAVTGLGRQEDVRRAREAGFAGHFVKPVDVTALDRRIREWLAASSR